MTIHVYTATSGKVASIILEDQNGKQLDILGDDLTISDADFMSMPVDQLLTEYFTPAVNLIRDLMKEEKRQGATILDGDL